MPAYVNSDVRAPMSSIENLKKQAKQILRRRREGYYPVAAQIRALHPRFHGLSDSEIFAAEFRIGDAHEMVARRCGFPSWQALKEEIDTMSTDHAETPALARLVSAEPQLFVRDVRAACGYYCATLGFTVVFQYGDPPFYAQVRRDGAVLNLRHTDMPVFDPERVNGEDLLAVTITLDSAAQIKLLFLEYRTAGAQIDQSLSTEPWGSRTFIVRDPDGNLLLFAGPGT